MRWTSRYALSLAVVSFLLLPQTVSAQAAGRTKRTLRVLPDSALRVEIRNLNRQMEMALGRGDMMAVAAFYADDGVLKGPRGQEVRGRAAIDAYWVALKDAKSWKLDVFEVGGSRTEAYQVGRSTLVMGSASGDRASVSDFVLIWKRGADGRMRIALDFYHF